jgi:hypothetical protein
VRVTSLDRLADTLQQLLLDQQALAALRQAVPPVLPGIDAAAMAYQKFYRTCLSGAAKP